MKIQIQNIIHLLGAAIVLGTVISAPVKSAGENSEHAAIDIQGDFVQGGLVLGKVSAGSTVTYDGQDVRVSEAGQFVIGFHRDELATVPLQITLPSGEQLSRSLEIAPREYNIQRVEGVPQRTVDPPADQIERIQREAREIGAAKRTNRPHLDFLGAWQWPVAGPISGVYGSQRVYNGTPGRPHYGVDIARPTGTPVHAPQGGYVTFANPDTYFSGGLILIDHGHGLSSSFLHLSAVNVEVGQRVEQGEVIGEIGATGRASGPHLDWRMDIGKRRVDPQLLVEAMPE
ncbi:MAG: M23 family metallopeptidase [Proteobacteria bacterium]|jgi:murein DD-endopeptidase MepM/ murein hydrolase activator NlpD|nr:M23 family metallopeptidase [Pseudomonadota bacterium]